MNATDPLVTINWKWRSFEELSTSELYSILKLRQEIFVLEQKCFYLDCDGLDTDSWHLMGMRINGGKPELIAYLRVIFPGKKTVHPAIGRLLTHKKVRKKGVARQLLRQGIIHTDRTYPGSQIQLSAQVYLEQFYNDFGFVAVSEPYDEDGILHIDMIRSL